MSRFRKQTFTSSKCILRAPADTGLSNVINSLSFTKIVAFGSPFPFLSVLEDLNQFSVARRPVGVLYCLYSSFSLCQIDLHKPKISLYYLLRECLPYFSLHLLLSTSFLPSSSHSHLLLCIIHAL